MNNNDKPNGGQSGDPSHRAATAPPPGGPGVARGGVAPARRQAAGPGRGVGAAAAERPRDPPQEVEEEKKQDAEPQMGHHNQNQNQDNRNGGKGQTNIYGNVQRDINNGGW